MKTKIPAILATFAALLGTSVLGLAADAKKKQADAYPLTTCLVAGDPLGKDDFVSYTHKEAGKPDRVIRLCCEGCIDEFKATPTKFLAKLDAAEAAMKAKAAKKK